MENVFKDRINKLMSINNVTQMDLADALQITQSTLSRNINGVHRPKYELVEKLAKYFNVSTDYLTGVTDNPEPNSVAFSGTDSLNGLTQEQMKEVLKFVDFIKERDKK